jgi:hypothetical protein
LLRKNKAKFLYNAERVLPPKVLVVPVVSLGQKWQHFLPNGVLF